MDNSNMNILVTSLSTVVAVIIGQYLNYILKLRRKRIDYFSRQITIFGDKMEEIESKILNFKNDSINANHKYFFSRVNNIWNQTVVNAEYFKKVSGTKSFGLITYKLDKVRQKKNKEKIIEQFTNIENFLTSAISFKGKINPDEANSKTLEYIRCMKIMVNNFNTIRRGIDVVIKFEFSNIIGKDQDQENIK